MSRRAIDVTKHRILLLPVIAWLLAYVATATACPMALSSREVVVKNTRLKLEIASTPEARECGLSKRTVLAADEGMLFVVPEPITLDFWMTETSLTLSIAFLDANGKILSIQDMKPGQTREHYRSPAPAKYAIEVNQGWFNKQGIEVGDVVQIHLPAVLRVR